MADLPTPSRPGHHRAVRSGPRRLLGGITALAMVLSVLVVAELGGAPSASAAVPGESTPPIATKGADHVTSDALPTVQVNGVVWDQEIVGNKVYVVGQFTSARPAGSPAGVNETPRSNMLAYNLTTGELDPTFAPVLNRQAKTVTASPDGSRIYIGGEFTTVNGLNRWRIAALDPVTGALTAGFNAVADFRVNTIVATSTTLYVGGAFTSAGTVPRSRLAAYSATTGALLADWNPGADAEVFALTLAPDGSRLFVGGRFQNVAGAPAYGLAAVDPVTGALIPWAANQVIRNAGNNSAILSLSTDGTNIYGSGYHFGSGGNLEGAFSADPVTGLVNWVEDCHGDTYDAVPVNGYLYTVSHAHYCGNLDGFGQSATWGVNGRETMSFTLNATGTLRREPWGYTNWQGTPAPSLVQWFPDLAQGTYTGIEQAAWTVEGNSDYVVMGGEFPEVNGTPQYGLVRFARKPIASGTDGPRLGSTNFPINVRSTAPGRVRISFPSNWDRDDRSLNYRIIRDGNTAAPVYQATIDSAHWDRPIVAFTDTGLTPGATHTYRVRTSDADGNTAWSDTYTVTVASSGSASAYSDTVMANGGRMHWRLGATVGSVTARDELGFRNLNVGSAVTFGATGALLGDADTAATLSNSVSSTMVDPNIEASPDTFSLEAWVRTSSSTGGRIMGYSNRTSGTSTSYDRVLYLTNNGRITFGVNNGSRRTVESPSGFNDGQWHHVVGTVGLDGMNLYVDGVKVGSRSDATGGQGFNGYWRVGADTLSNWNNRPTTDYLTGTIDEPAVYYKVLTPAQVAQNYAASGRNAAVNPAPADAYGASVHAGDPWLYYRLAEASGTTANDSGRQVNPGDYVNTVGRGATGVVNGNAAANFTGAGFVASRNSVYAPTTYSLETWVNTTSTTGGQLIGFGNTRSGNSTTADRQVYLRDDGRLAYSIQPVRGSRVTLVTPNTYNDGQWHHVVAVQSATGLQLYVDNTLVATGAPVVAQAFAGFWRIGGDSTNGGSTSSNVTARLDEAAVYDRALQPSEIQSHFVLGGGQLPNVAPTASFTSAVDKLDVTFNGTASSDSDGSVVSYAWDFGDGTTGTGATPSKTYAAAGTYNVTLTVTDDDGATAQVAQPVTAIANVAPTASFTSSANKRTVSFNAAASSDSDGSVVSYAWDFGDGTTGTGATATRTYAVAGTYNVTLTVTDDDGATGQVTLPATAIANQAPTPAFSSQTVGLQASVNGSASTDADGTVASYAWDFGDGTTGTGATAQRTYAAPGTYNVTLTVTDDEGATAQLTKPVTVTSFITYAADDFERTVTNGFGTAPTGGAWTLTGTAANFAVNGGQGRITIPAAGQTRAATVTPAGAVDAESTVQFTLDKVPTGGGVYVSSVLRKTGTSEYRLRVRYQPTATTLQLQRLVGGVETTLASVNVPGFVYTPGTVINMKFRATGSGTTTLQGKLWHGADPEPAAWQIQTTDTTAALQTATGVGVVGYLSGSSTNAPVVLGVDNLVVRSF